MLLRKVFSMWLSGSAFIWLSPYRCQQKIGYYITMYEKSSSIIRVMVTTSAAASFFDKKETYPRKKKNSELWTEPSNPMVFFKHCLLTFLYLLASTMFIYVSLFITFLIPYFKIIYESPFRYWFRLFWRATTL
jgi:hypothetical protein